MSKKDNLLKFWESLESNHQTSEVIKPYRPQTQSLKMKSKSQIDLLCPRPSIVPSIAQLQGVTGSMDTITTELDDLSSAEIEKSEVGSLPIIPRNKVLSHTTKSRARRPRTHPTRQKKTAKVPCVEVIPSVDEQMSPNLYQTPPAADNEFSNFKHSPTSARFLDKSPLPTPHLDATSPKPATSLGKPQSAFTSFLSNPLKFTKAQETKSIKKESPAVPKRNLIPSSPKVSPRHKEGTEGTGIKPGRGQHFPGNLKSPFHENSRPITPSKSPITFSKANFTEQRSSSLKSVATSKVDITERRASLKAISTPYKSLQAGISPLKPEPATIQPITSPRIARLTANFQAATSSPASKTTVVKALDLEAGTSIQQHGTVNSTSELETGEAFITQSKAGAAPALTLTASVQACSTRNINMGGLPVVKEGTSHHSNTSGNENEDYNVFVNEINKKVKDLESAVAEEKLARIKLEKEVTELKLIVTKLSLSS